MHVLILEDEKSISDLLVRFIHKIDPSIEVDEVLTSVKGAFQWFLENEEPDLIFMDVHLEDGNSFELFEQIRIEAPIVFITGYDEYALKAFKVNSIDYLLKPVNLPELEKSIAKYNRISGNSIEKSSANINKLVSQLNLKENYKSRFLVKSGKSLLTIPVEEVAYFYTENKLVFLQTNARDRYILDTSLDDLAGTLNPENFFRLNRQFLVSFESIAGIQNYFNNRLVVKLKPEPKDVDQVMVSSKKVNEFKQWLDK